MICFIPTKSRFNTKTYCLFEKVGIKVYHFIEPCELNQYDVPNKVSIERDNQGVSYVRNFMLDFAKRKNIGWVIICDDDVTGFGIYNGKTLKTDAGIWKEIYEKVKSLPFEVVGINYAQHAWHEKTKYSINKKLAEVCVLLNTSKINWSYKPNTKEDRDFQLQTIKNGSGVLRFNHYWFNCPNVGTNAGGLFELYKAKKDNEWAKNLSQDWHPFVKLVEKNNRIDAKIDLKSFSIFYRKQIK